jgi:hypothetical protein
MTGLWLCGATIRRKERERERATEEKKKNEWLGESLRDGMIGPMKRGRAMGPRCAPLRPPCFSRGQWMDGWMDGRTGNWRDAGRNRSWAHSWHISPTHVLIEPSSSAPLGWPWHVLHNRLVLTACDSQNPAWARQFRRTAARRGAEKSRPGAGRIIEKESLSGVTMTKPGIF